MNDLQVGKLNLMELSSMFKVLNADSLVNMVLVRIAPTDGWISAETRSAKQPNDFPNFGQIEINVFLLF